MRPCTSSNRSASSSTSHGCAGRASTTTSSPRCSIHGDLDAALATLPDARVWAFTTQATTSFVDVAFADGDALLFGPEPTGLSPEVLAHPRLSGQLRIPMLPGRRSMNLSNAAAVATYEAWRQLGFPGGA